MIFVITGATSFIGLELIRYLLDNNHIVVAVCRPDSKGLIYIPAEVKIVFSEMCEYRRLYEIIPHADVLINLAWKGTEHQGRNEKELQKENIRNTTAAMYAAKKMGCKLFLESGSQAEYGSTTEPQKEDSVCNPFSEYGKAKLQVKEDLFLLSEKLGIKYIHLRIFSLFGENDHSWTLIMTAIDKMLKNESLELSSCTQNWNFLYIKDAVKIITMLCEKAIESPEFRHEVYNIASDDTRQLKYFVERIKLISNSTSNLYYGAVVPQDFVSLQPDITKTVLTSGFAEFHSFDSVIKAMINNKQNYM